MKFFNLFFLLLISTVSCKSQEKIDFKYAAQTRGYQLYITLIENNLDITENGKLKSIELSKEQLTEIDSQLSLIDFSLIENNLSIENAAVDKAIPANFELNYSNKEYNFEFDHIKLPKEIEKFITFLKALEE